MTEEQILARINQLRREILVHSVIYYRLNDNIISDEEWSRRAKELYDLQNKYPEISKMGVYAKDFENFDYSTGCNLPLGDPWALNKAVYLLRICSGKEF